VFTDANESFLFQYATAVDDKMVAVNEAKFGNPCMVFWSN